MKIDLNPEEVSVLVDALSEKPYKEVSSLISKLTPSEGIQKAESMASSFNSSIGVSSSQILLG